MQVISTTGTALFERELSDMIQDHFKELLDELHEADTATDEGIANSPPTPIFSSSSAEGLLQLLRGELSHTWRAEITNSNNI